MERYRKKVEYLRRTAETFIKSGYAVDGIAKCFEESADAIEQLAEELKQFKDKQEQGLLISLPCKVGDTIFDICGKEICSYKITGFSFGTSDNFVDEPIQEDDIIFYCSDSTGIMTGSFSSCEIGKIIFLTEAEAEEALARMKGE